MVTGLPVVVELSGLEPLTPYMRSKSRAKRFLYKAPLVQYSALPMGTNRHQ